MKQTTQIIYVINIILIAFFLIVVFLPHAKGQQTASTANNFTLNEQISNLLDNIRSGEKKNITFGTIGTLEAFVCDIKSMEKRNVKYVKRMTNTVNEIIDAAKKDKDILKTQRGMFWRGYKSKYSYKPQIYSIYVPESYNQNTPIPLIVTLHGGSSNHNVWLAMNLGNKISTKDYWNNFRTKYKAKRHPSAIVVSPDGLGQIRWRWAGEQDVLDVIDDAMLNYNINPDKIFISGLSNGAIGTYTIGLKHASRFAAILPLAGVTNWLSHHEADGQLRSCEQTVLKNESAITYAENAANTHFRFFHGDKDPGFSVEQARQIAKKLKRLSVPFKFHEFKNQGHDLGYVLWRKLLINQYVSKYSRNIAPTNLRLVTASSRALNQGWLYLNERFDHTSVARLNAVIKSEQIIEVETKNIESFTIALDECPVISPVKVIVDGQNIYNGPIPIDNKIKISSVLAPAINTLKPNGDSVPMWNLWDGIVLPQGTRKIERLSGPLGDAQYDSQIHVYGTMVEKDTGLLKKAARLGARGWMMAANYTEVRHEIISDKQLTYEMMRNNTIVLYGNGANNSILADIGHLLPIKVGSNYLEMRGKKIFGWGVGARFICPNPIVPTQYIVVATGTSADAVEKGGRLPIYLADYIVYNHQTTKRKAFMILGSRKEIETGFFTENWKLPKRDN